MEVKELCKYIGNFYGKYFEENGQLCIDNYEKVFRYNTEKELLKDWVNTLVCSHYYDCILPASPIDSWEHEIRFIYENVIGKNPKGVRIYRGKTKNRYVAEGYVADGTPHGKMKYLGTFDSITEAICAVWTHEGYKF